MEPIEILAVLFLGALVLLIGYMLGRTMGIAQSNRSWEQKVPELRKSAIKQSRAVLGGQFSEQLAPYLPDFPYSPTEVRFLGKPIDFLVFVGMDEKHIQEVVFVEVKSGNAQLSPVERKLRDAIQAKRVRWEEYRIPQDVIPSQKK